MSESNLTLRDIAVPFVSWHILVNPAQFMERYIYECPVLSNANLIEAYATLFIPVESDISVRVAIGMWAESQVEAITAYTDKFIKLSHERITGSESAIQSSGGVLLLDGVNLMLDRTKFNEHGFVLILDLDRSLTADESTRLSINCSSIMGLV